MTEDDERRIRTTIGYLAPQTRMLAAAVGALH